MAIKAHTITSIREAAVANGGAPLTQAQVDLVKAAVPQLNTFTVQSTNEERWEASPAELAEIARFMDLYNIDTLDNFREFVGLAPTQRLYNFHLKVERLRKKNALATMTGHPCTDQQLDICRALAQVAEEKGFPKIHRALMTALACSDQVNAELLEQSWVDKARMSQVLDGMSKIIGQDLSTVYSDAASAVNSEEETIAAGLSSGVVVDTTPEPNREGF